MSQYKHKLVNGELVELTAEEIAELERRDADAAAAAQPPEAEEPDHAKRRTHKR